jgi:hypothetical protein
MTRDCRRLISKLCKSRGNVLDQETVSGRLEIERKNAGIIAS